MMMSQNPHGLSPCLSLPSTQFRSTSVNAEIFFSAPSSPGDALNANPQEFEFETRHRFYSDDFQFGRSQNFENHFDVNQHEHSHQQQQQHQHGDPLPSVAFADELFNNGRVLPLKLPPRFHSLSQGNRSPAISSPRSPSSILKFDFQHRSLWNDGYDPFAVALNNVKERQRGRDQENNYRRTRSVSPLRIRKWSNDQSSQPVSNNQNLSAFARSGPLDYQLDYEKEAKDFTPSRCIPHRDNRMNSYTSPETNGLRFEGQPEPKRLIIARRLRPLSNENGSSNGTELRNNGGSKRWKIKGLLFRNASATGECNVKNKREDQNYSALWKAQLMKRISFMSSAARSNEENRKRVPEREIKTLVRRNRPTSFLCLSFGFEVPIK